MHTSALLLAACAGIASASISLGRPTIVLRDDTMEEQGFTPFFLTANDHATSLRIVLDTNAKSIHDSWEVHTGPATYCSAEHFNGGAWPFTKVFDSQLYPGVPHDTGIIPGAPSEKFCIALQCVNPRLNCKGIEIIIELFVSDPSTQSCSSGGVFPDPITSVAKESDVSPGWKCAYYADDGGRDDHDLLPLVTVAPVPGGPVETLRWCKGASICLSPGYSPSASPYAISSPATASSPAAASTPPVPSASSTPPSTGGSGCPAGMVRYTGSPTSFCVPGYSTQSCTQLFNVPATSFVNVDPPTGDTQFTLGRCPGGQTGNCHYSCENCVFDCVYPSSSADPTPSRTPSRTPTRSPSVTPSRTPSVSPTPSTTPSRSATPSRTPSRSPAASVLSISQSGPTPGAQAGADDDAAQSAGGVDGATSGGGSAQGTSGSGADGGGGGGAAGIVGAIVGVLAVAGVAAGGYWYYTKQQQQAGKPGAAKGQSGAGPDFHMVNPVNIQAAAPAPAPGAAPPAYTPGAV